MWVGGRVPCVHFAAKLKGHHYSERVHNIACACISSARPPHQDCHSVLVDVCDGCFASCRESDVVSHVCGISGVLKAVRLLRSPTR
jgi:hypothetical protein